MRSCIWALLSAIWFTAAGAAQPPGRGGNGTSPDSFETILLKVITAREDNFQSIKGKAANIPDSTGHFPRTSVYPVYWTTVTLPGFSCALAGPNNQPAGTQRAALPLRYWCSLEVPRGPFSSTLVQAYDDLVEKVKIATGLPDHVLNIPFKVETSPGSGVLEADRSTVFARKDLYVGESLLRRPYISVELTGGLHNWEVILEVGSQWGM